jgi:hypothetical protein
MERIVPWFALLSLVKPQYAKAGNGRRPVGLEIMLRVYFRAAVVQPVGSGRGGGDVRISGAAAVRGRRSLVRRLRRMKRPYAASAIYWKSTTCAA